MEGGVNARQTVGDLFLQQLQTRAGILFGVVPTFASRLDLPSAPFVRKPSEPGFKWTTAGVVVEEGRVYAPWMTELECLQVRFEGMSEKNGDRRCREEIQETGLDF